MKIIKLFYILLFAMANCLPAFSAVYTVTNTNDAGAGSLRQAMISAEANSGADVINITATGTVTLSFALPNITQDLTINGSGMNDFIIDANGGYNPLTLRRIFTITSGIVSINNLTVTKGLIQDATHAMGGGIYNAGTLRLENVAVIDNSVVGLDVSNGDGVDAEGGGIYTSGPIVIINCSIKDNNTSGGQTDDPVATGGNSRGGGICIAGGTNHQILYSTIANNGADPGRTNSYNNWGSPIGGGIECYSGNNLVLFNCTITDNYVSDAENTMCDCFGAGISCGAPGDIIKISNCLIANNLTYTVGSGTNIFGGGIYSKSASAGNGPIIKNTIITGNSFSGSNGPDCYNFIQSRGYNLISDLNGFTLDVASPNTNTGNLLGSSYNANLDVLAYNGGPTETMALLTGSDAIDAGSGTDIDGNAVTQDQRHFYRYAPFDMGPYEYNSSNIAIPLLPMWGFIILVAIILIISFLFHRKLKTV